jgi:hypothetical protein
MFFGVTGKKCITFLLPALSPTLIPALDLIPDLALCPTSCLAQKWWANQENGFFSCFPPPATELLTTQFWLLNRAIIGSLCFSSWGII